MSADRKTSKALAALFPGGALGASILLALTSSVGEARSAQTVEPVPQSNVAARLSSIRAAVSVLGDPTTAESSGSGAFAPEGAPRAEQTWWGNGGWGRWHGGWGNGGGWPNWHNWHNGWGNGGNWGNGGWHNYWHNW